MNSLHTLALAPNLPEAAQRALLRSGDQRTRELVTARDDLDAELAKEHLASSSRTLRKNVLANISDTNVLAAEAAELERAGKARDLEAIASNPNTPPEILTELARSTKSSIKLRALCNPSTPEGSRKEALSDPKVAAHLVRRRSPLGAQVVRAGQLTMNNRWLLRHARKQDLSILRGLTGLPECPRTVLTAAGTSRWASSALHPRLFGAGPETMDCDELAEHPSAAAHIALIAREECTPKHAARLLAGYKLRSGRRIDAEPHVLAAALKRFRGSMIQATDRIAPLAGTRIETTRWANQHAGDLLHAFATWGRPNAARDLKAAAESIALLDEAGDSFEEHQEMWHMFVRLAQNSESPTELPVTARTATLI